MEIVYCVFREILYIIAVCATERNHISYRLFFEEIMSKFFLSHSSTDIELAKEIKKSIIDEILNVEVFLSPGSISSSNAWFDSIITNLSDAEVLIILLTPNSERSDWVMFEAGHFWSTKKGENIHILHHPTANIPSPLNRVQTKFINNMEDLENVFASLCKNVGQEYLHRVDLSNIVSLANKIKFESLADRAKKRQLILEMGSTERTTSIPATEELRDLGWLLDGSLRGQSFKGANLEKAQLQDADLQESNLQNTSLENAYLLNANLQSANLDSANLQGASLWCVNLQNAKLSYGRMQKATLINANLKEANLTFTQLNPADLRSANLEGADLRLAKLQGASLQEANLKDAILSENLKNNFDETTILPDGNSWASNINMKKFTDPNNPDFWRSDDFESPAYY